MRNIVHYSKTGAIGWAVAIACLLGGVNAARAGGFDLPDEGAEALGRGGAFVAKADNGLAMYYNIAGLGRQEGTRLTVDLNVVYHDVAFTRAGTYPTDASDPSYAGKAYPTVHDSQKWSTLPFLGISHNFKVPYIRHLAIGFGVYGPPGIQTHRYGTRTEVQTADPDSPTIAYRVKLPDGTTAPAPTRYDIADTNLLILLPTLGVAISPWKWLDIGGAVQLVYAHFDLMNANTGAALLGPRCGADGDNPDCDAYGHIKTSGFTVGGLVSLMLHPTDWLDIGVNYRPQINIKTKGTLHAYPPPALTAKIDDAHVSFQTRLPHELRLGIRGVFRYADQTERADVEVDGTWENWSAVQGDRIYSDDFQLGKGGELEAYVPHQYRDTFGVRIGSSYNFRLTDTQRLSPRIGFYFDSAASRYPQNHLDFPTASKYAATLGLGYKYRGFTINAAYAFIYSPDRTVTNSTLRAISAINGSNWDHEPETIYGNGKYETTLHMMSIGLSFNFEEFKLARLMPN